MNFERVRKLLVEKAIRGNLVPQLEEEPTVEQLGEKPLTVPFDIPTKWKWVRLSQVGKVVGGGTPKTDIAEYWNGDIPWVTPVDLGKLTSKFVYSGSKSITKEGLNKSAARLLETGSVVYSSRAPIGYVAIAKNKICTNQGCKSLVPNFNVITSEWGYWCLMARTQDIISRASGTTFKEISGKGVGETWIPLPSIEEQKRISDRLNELFTEIDKAEAAYNELQSMSGLLRSQILQRAIEGRLVEQREDEPEVKQFGESLPREDEPFSIPEKWKWVKLSSIGKIVGGGTPQTKVEGYWGGGIPWITPADLGKLNDKFISIGAKNISESGLNNSSARLIPGGSVIYSSRAPIGYVAIAKNDLCTNQGCKSFIPNKCVVRSDWGYFCMLARTPDIISRASGTTFKEISGTGVGNTWIPLSPIKEQWRIVAKLNKYMALIEEIKC